MASDPDVGVPVVRRRVVSLYPDSISSATSQNYREVVTMTRTFPAFPAAAAAASTQSPGCNETEARVLIDYINTCLPLETRVGLLSEFGDGLLLEELLASLSGGQYKAKKTFSRPVKPRDRLQSVMKYLKSKAIWHKASKGRSGVNHVSVYTWRVVRYLKWRCSYYLDPGGGCEVLFSPGLSVCVSGRYFGILFLGY